MRALRFVFSVEKNRKVFKRLFPPDLFAMFIDVGQYECVSFILFFWGMGVGGGGIFC
jgi:hypothetical protein